MNSNAAPKPDNHKQFDRSQKDLISSPKTTKSPKANTNNSKTESPSLNSSQKLSQRRSAVAPIRNIKPASTFKLDFQSVSGSVNAICKDSKGIEENSKVAGKVKVESNKQGTLASPVAPTAQELSAEVLGVRRTKTFDELPKSEREILY